MFIPLLFFSPNDVIVLYIDINYYKTSWKEITVHISTSNFLSFCFEMYSDSNI